MLYSCYNCHESKSGVCDYHNTNIAKTNQGPHWARHAVVIYNDIQLMTGRGEEWLVDRDNNVICQFINGNFIITAKAGDPNEVTKAV